VEPSGETPPESVFVLRRGLFGYRRSDVLNALEQQRRQLEGLAESVDRLWREKERAWHASYAVSTAMLSQKGRYEAQILAERIRGAQAEADARVQAAEIVAHAEERAAAIHSQAGEQFQDVSRKLRELLELRDELVRDVVSGLHGQASILDRWARRLHTTAPAPSVDTQLALDAELVDRVSESAA
jgi:hypothetical protein